MRVLFPLSAAKEERLAKREEKKEGSTKWSQGTSNRICPLPERTPRTHAGSIPWLALSRNHQETWSRVDTVSPEWQAGNYLCSKVFRLCMWRVLFNIVNSVKYIPVSTEYLITLYYWAYWSGICSCTQKPQPRTELQVLSLYFVCKVYDYLSCSLSIRCCRLLLFSKPTKCNFIDLQAVTCCFEN